MEDGTLDQAKVVRGIDPLLDEEAIARSEINAEMETGNG